MIFIFFDCDDFIYIGSEKFEIKTTRISFPGIFYEIESYNYAFFTTARKKACQTRKRFLSLSFSLINRKLVFVYN